MKLCKVTDVIRSFCLSFYRSKFAKRDELAGSPVN